MCRRVLRQFIPSSSVITIKPTNDLSSQHTFVEEQKELHVSVSECTTIRPYVTEVKKAIFTGTVYSLGASKFTVYCSNKMYYTRIFQL
jgi:hypothetical protein